MALCKLWDTAVGADMFSHHKFSVALVKDFVQFLVTLCTTSMTTGIVVQCSCAVYFQIACRNVVLPLDALVTVICIVKR